MIYIYFFYKINIEFHVNLINIDALELNKGWTDMSARRDRRLHQLLLGSKMPLEKSRSMPDIQTKNKKKERLRA